MITSGNNEMYPKMIIKPQLTPLKLSRDSLTGRVILSDFEQLEEIAGDIFISCGEVVLTRSADGSSDKIHDAIVCLMMGFHRVISQLFDTSISSVVTIQLGVKFQYHRSVLLISAGGPCAHKPTSEILMFSPDLQSPPLFNQYVLRTDLADEVQRATEDLIEQLIASDPELEKHHSVKELRACYQRTNQILHEYRKSVGE